MELDFDVLNKHSDHNLSREFWLWLWIYTSHQPCWQKSWQDNFNAQQMTNVEEQAEIANGHRHICCFDKPAKYVAWILDWTTDSKKKAIWWNVQSNRQWKYKPNKGKLTKPMKGNKTDATDTKNGMIDDHLDAGHIYLNRKRREMLRR